MAMNFYLTQTHNTPISYVEISEEGEETWTVYASGN